MAENKKGVILYADLIHTFEELSDDEAGRLIKHFFRYVNDLNPEAPDKITKLLFQPIKLQLKRDLEKWEGIREKRSEAGKASALKKQQEAEKAQLEEQNSTSVDKTKQALTDSTVSVTVNVTDTVIDKEDKSFVELPSATTTGGTSVSDRAVKFVSHFNKTKLKFTGTEGKFRATGDVLKKFKSRVKDYKSEQIVQALNKAFTHQLHKEQNFEYLTPSYILREEILERYLNINEAQLKSNTPIYTPAPKPIDHASRA